MEDEVVDTTETPAESAEPTEPTDEQTEVTEEVQEEVQEETPGYITAEQLQESLAKQDSSFRSWLGRRDKETLNRLSEVIDQKLSRPETPDEISTRLLENPRDVIRSEFKAMQNEETQQHTVHLNSTMDSIGMLMEADPLYTDKALGDEVVAQLGDMVKTGKIDSSLHPDAASKVALAEAVTAVFRKRAGTKTSPLAGNKPKNTGSGLKPGTPTSYKPKVPKLDAETAKWAKKWNYSDEEIARVLGE